VGVDIKTANGLVVMPPSIHPVTGQRYRWEVSGPVAPLPEHLIARVVKPARRIYHGSDSKMTEAQLTGIIRKMEDAIIDRNNTLLWCACRLFERNADADAFVQLEMAASYTGLEDDEIARTIESAANQVGR
jgi:Bifunctional DNA primase/polymerase, N-terminal